MTDRWTPSSWRNRPAMHIPADYPDPAALARVEAQLRAMPPLVFAGEARRLKSLLADVAGGRAFLLQGGDCAESFKEFSADNIRDTFRLILQMAVVLTFAGGMPVVKVGRIAGQFAKPRSSDTETRGGITLPSYRGDIVNGPEFSAAARTPDPRRLVRAHAASAMTMNFVRALIDGGFADLHHPEYWDLGWVEHSPLAREYKHMVDSIGEAVRFMETLAGEPVGSFSRVDFYTSHEALLLHYEQALTRQVPRQWGWFNLSTHFPWIGMRTAALDGAHVEYCRGIRNPIGIKIGPGVAADALLRLADAVDPHQEPGRLALIHRMGAAKVGQALPPLLEAVRRSGRRPLWICDPMHGNTESLASGVKTRRFDNIRSELDQAFDIHAAAGTQLGGVHLELTGENVTECLGGARDLAENDLARAYKSTVDPRLNYEQSLELAMMIVRKRGVRPAPLLDG